MSRLRRDAATAGRCVVWLMPTGRREWAEALWTEADTAPPGRPRLAWRAGGLRLVTSEVLARRRVGRVLLFVAAATLMAWTTWPVAAGRPVMVRRPARSPTQAAMTRASGDGGVPAVSARAATARFRAGERRPDPPDQPAAVSPPATGPGALAPGALAPGALAPGALASALARASAPLWADTVRIMWRCERT